MASPLVEIKAQNAYLIYIFDCQFCREALRNLRFGGVRFWDGRTFSDLSCRSVDVAGMLHETVNHSAKEYVRGIVHTNGIEGSWSQIKRSIKGTHVNVSNKHLPKYLGEFQYRYNMRRAPHLMFSLLVSAF